MNITLKLTTVLFAMCATGGGVAVSPGGAQQDGPQDECDSDRLGSYRVVDTTHLTRSVREGPIRGATEGQSVVTYDSSGRVRLAVVSTLGEMGKTVQRLYLVDQSNFAVETEEYSYAEPIGMNPRPVVTSRYLSVAYVCDGRVVLPATDSAVAGVRTLVETLTTARRAR